MEDFLQQLAQQLKDAAKRPNVLSYVPNSPTHEEFHKSTKVGRLLRGGNRSGKSVAGGVEGIWRATGRHPYHSTHELPVKGRIVTVDREGGLDQIILPLLKQWIPQSEFINGSWEDSFTRYNKLLKLRNGSEIEIKTHQQEVDSFAGVPRHWVWFDEECPSAIFNECRMRLIDYNGCWWMTMTPVEGQDWIYDRFITSENKNVDMFEVNIADNPHLSKEALQLLEEDLTDEEKEVRQKGIFVPKGGLVFKKFDYNRHVISPNTSVPKGWGVYVSIDHGFNNPTAVLWHAVSPQMDVVTFYEHYQKHWTIEQHAIRIKEINKELGITPQMYVGDPSMSQRTAESGISPLKLYQRNGIPLVQAKRDVDGGINKMNEYFENDKWHITEDCRNTIKEFRGYSFKIYYSHKIADRSNAIEQPNKKNDHTPDSARYFFSFLPRLTDQQKMKRERQQRVSKTITNRDDFPWEVDAGFIYTGSTSNTEEYGFGEI